MEIKGSLENALSEIDALRAKMSELTKRKDIHQIELDLLLQKLRELYDFLRSLQPAEELNLIVKAEPEKPVKSVKKIEKPKPIGFKLEKPEEIVKENAKETIDIPASNDTSHAEHEKHDHVHISGKNEESKKSVHELISETAHKKPAHIGATMHSKPIHNIEDAIALNDKFLFIRELFGSNADLYKNTIQTLNNATDFNSAYSHIEKNFQWDPENETAQKLLELIRRRHISHKNG